MSQTMAEYLIEQGEARGKVLGIQEGEVSGEVRTIRANIVKLLHLRFNEVPEPLVRRVNRTRSLTRLKALFQEAATVDRVEDLEW